MISVESIRIQDFRGIRDLTVKLDGKNFAVCGPNGTGKSGIVDALEFGLTGSISRLTGKGRGLLSVKEHGPHVNSRGKPQQAIITLDVVLCETGKKAKITRNVKSPKAPVIVPEDPDVRAAFAYAEKHPEITLSRREIIKYILAEPGVRASEIQALLQLEKLETTRSLLLKIANASAKELRPLELARNNAADQLMRAMQISDLKVAVLLEAVNRQRTILELIPIEKTEATTNIRDGLESQSASAAKVPKAQAKTDLSSAHAAIEALRALKTAEAWLEALQKIRMLKANEARLAQISRDAMLKAALEHFDEQSCPVCETPWQPEDFRAVVAAQRAALSEAAQQRAEAEQSLASLLTVLEALPVHLAPLIEHCRNLTEPIDPQALIGAVEAVNLRAQAVHSFLPLDATMAALENEITELAPANALLEGLGAAVALLPEPSARDAARDILTRGQERLEIWRGAAHDHSKARIKSQLAAQVHSIYGATCDAALETIYKDVEAEFRALYRTINGDDESAFEAQLTPSLGKLGFEVDFYGKGFFPPGAYHSEGHQDGMGLCLYLALMKHLLGDGFTLAVLDDVLMSVDAGHRREVCTLLKTKFPKTQFVLTTHDHVWLNHMRHSKLVEAKSALTFRKWHVDHGPSEWKDSDVWSEIDDLVGKNEIRAAAAQLRNYLEYVSAEWCARLGGRVEFKSHGKYELGDLLPAAVGAMNSLYKKAKASAQSWSNQRMHDEIDANHDVFSKAASETQAEQWQINPAIHYNEWENLQRQDFEPVVGAFKELERQLQCPACGDGFYVVHSGNEKESVRCACSNVNLNLKMKPR